MPDTRPKLSLNNNKQSIISDDMSHNEGSPIVE